MSLSEKIAALRAPHLGTQSADVVARHICAKYGVEEAASAEQPAQLTEVPRRGLVAHVGTEKAAELAAQSGKLTSP